MSSGRKRRHTFTAAKKTHEEKFDVQFTPGFAFVDPGLFSTRGVLKIILRRVITELAGQGCI